MCMCADGVCMLTFTDVRQCVEAEVGIKQYLSTPCLETGELGAYSTWSWPISVRLTSSQWAPGRDPPISASVLESQAHTVFNMSTGNPTQDLMLAQQVHYSLSLFPGPHSQSLFCFETVSLCTVLVVLELTEIQMCTTIPSFSQPLICSYKYRNSGVNHHHHPLYKINKFQDTKAFIAQINSHTKTNRHTRVFLLSSHPLRYWPLWKAPTMPLGVKFRINIQLGSSPSLTSISFFSFSGTERKTK